MAQRSRLRRWSTLGPYRYLARPTQIASNACDISVWARGKFSPNATPRELGQSDEAGTQVPDSPSRACARASSRRRRRRPSSDAPLARRALTQNAIEAHKNRPFRWETQISPVPTYGIPGHHLGRSTCRVRQSSQYDFRPKCSYVPL